MRKTINLDELGENPYLEGLIIPVYKRTSITAVPLNFETGTMYLPSDNEYYLEGTRFTKVFASIEIRKIITSLSGVASRLLWFITYDLEGGKQYYVANKQFITKELKLPHQRELNSYFKELIDKGLLDKTNNSDVYWVTPHLFKGDRITTYFKNVRVIND